MLGRRTAAEIIARYGTNELKAITKGEGMRVVAKTPWLARFQEITVGRLILIPGNIPTAQRRSIIAHGLGHHFLHEGNQVWLRGLDRVWDAKQERQADEFAAWLMIPEREDGFLSGMSAEAVARRYRVTEELVRARRNGAGH